LGSSISLENKERLTFLIRSSGSHTPVICTANSSGDINSFADSTLSNNSSDLLIGVKELLAKNNEYAGGADNSGQ